MSVQSLSQGFSLSGLPILDFDPNDPIGFEIWLKKWRSWIYLSNLESKQTMYHSLIKCFTDKTMKVYCCLNLSGREEENPQVIIASLRNLLGKQSNRLLHRIELLQRTQGIDESFDDWLADLMKLTSQSKFREDCCDKCKDLRLLDQIVFGVKWSDVQKKLTDLGSNLSLNKAVLMIKNYERAEAQAKYEVVMYRKPDNLNRSIELVEIEDDPIREKAVKIFQCETCPETFKMLIALNKHECKMVEQSVPRKKKSIEVVMVEAKEDNCENQSITDTIVEEEQINQVDVPPAKKHKSNRGVWQYFKFQSNPHKTLCTLCDYSIPDLDGTTGPLHRHMTTYHAQEYAEILKSKSNSKKPTLSMEVSGLELTTEVQVMSEKDVIDTPVPEKKTCGRKKGSLNKAKNEINSTPKNKERTRLMKTQYDFLRSEYRKDSSKPNRQRAEEIAMQIPTKPQTVLKWWKYYGKREKDV